LSVHRGLRKILHLLISMESILWNKNFRPLYVCYFRYFWEVCNKSQGYFCSNCKKVQNQPTLFDILYLTDPKCIYQLMFIYGDIRAPPTVYSCASSSAPPPLRFLLTAYPCWLINMLNLAARVAECLIYSHTWTSSETCTTGSIFPHGWTWHLL
jgi:hypothetical protein